MYMVLRKYKIDPANKQELTAKITSGFIPLIQKIKGFVDYYCLYPDDKTLISVSVFQDKAGTDESVRLAADWVAKNIAFMLPEKPEIIAGEVVATGHEMRKVA